MNYKDFKKLLKAYKSANQKISDAYDVGIDLLEGKFEVQTPVTELFNTAIQSEYGEDGLDWVDWFIFENNYGKAGMEAFDENYNLICQTRKQLWEYLEKNHKNG